MDFNEALGIKTDEPPVNNQLPGADTTDITGNETPNTPPAGEPPVGDTPPAGAGEPPVQSQLPNTPPADAAPGSSQQPVNRNTILDEMSAGVIKDEAQLKDVLSKIAEYEQLKTKNTELAAEMARSPFVDDEVRILNELKAAGATKDQIKSFHQINEYGSIKEMPDRDALIAKMVMVDGVKPSVAELKVDRDFKLKNEDLSEEEKEILQDDLRVAAVSAKASLEKFKAEVSQANQTPPEEIQLQQQAKLLAHQAQVKPYVRDVMNSIPNLGTYNLSSSKDAAEAVNYEVPIDATIKAQLGQYVENYFYDGLTPVTPENTRLALNYARAEYFREHAQEVLQAAFERGVSLTTEKLVAKYENRSGIKATPENPVIGSKSEAAQTAEYMSNRVNRVGQ